MISIIISAYNNDNYIEECLDSVIKSTGNLNYEILVGIDNCKKTLLKCNELKKKYFDKVKFLFFQERVGTYIIRNTLAKEAKYDKLLFFDSDDVMNEILVKEVDNWLNSFDHIRYKYLTFNNHFNQNLKNVKNFSQTTHTGSFAINKKIFLESNGFEPWICAADGEFHWRMIKNGITTKNLNILGLYYRKHQNNLTVSQNTGMNSPLRKMYHKLKDIKIRKNILEPLVDLRVSSFIEIENIDNKNLNNLIKNEIKCDLSIIIPVYDNTDYIEECINSVISSGKDKSIEILVGIDGCNKTLEHLKDKNFPEQVKIYYFRQNNGPYDIKNTLTILSKSDNVLFFDSDDIMSETTINETVNNFKNYDVVRLKYQKIINGDLKSGEISFGEGVFAIKKDLFLSINGFEPWMCAADSDFMGRLYKIRPKIYHTNNISFYYRQHDKNLTVKKETGMMSSLRANYAKISKNKKGNGHPNELNIRDFITISVEPLDLTNQAYEYYNIRKSQLDKVLNSTPRKVVNTVTKKSAPVIEDRLDFLYNTPKSLVRTIKPNKPDDRQELINLKNNTNKSIHKELFNIKPNRRTGINPINIGGKSKL